MSNMGDADDKNATSGVTRRQILKYGLGVAGTGALSGTVAGEALAASKKIGTFPAGVSKDRVFIGVLVPETGPYSSAGKDLLQGYQIAFEHLNNGGGLVDRISTLKGNGVLGRHLDYKVADTETHANSAVEAATRFINKERAIMLTGSVSSSVAVAVQKVAQREKVLYMTGETTANATTGKDRQRYGFRSQVDGYMIAHAIAPVLGRQLGKGRKVAYLVPDYNSGHSIYRSIKSVTEGLGWKTTTNQLFQTGANDFSSQLLNIANTDADTFINIGYSHDAVTSILQAQNFGILDKMTMVIPLLSPYLAKTLGPDIMAGVYGSFDFYWRMEETYPAARMFVDSFNRKFGVKPRWGAEVAYTQMIMWADAVERAGTFNPPSVIKTLEAGKKVKTPVGDAYFRACDHQLVHDVPIVRGKAKKDMKGKDDFYEMVALFPGAKALPACDEFPGELGSYT